MNLTFIEYVGILVLAMWVLEAGLNLIDKYVGRK